MESLHSRESAFETTSSSRLQRGLLRTGGSPSMRVSTRVLAVGCAIATQCSRLACLPACSAAGEALGPLSMRSTAQCENFALARSLSRVRRFRLASAASRGEGAEKEGRRRRSAASALQRSPNAKTINAARAGAARERGGTRQNGGKKQKREPTAPRIPTWSPTVVLTGPAVA
jgi:hypothetical protein